MSFDCILKLGHERQISIISFTNLTKTPLPLSLPYIAQCRNVKYIMEMREPCDEHLHCCSVAIATNYYDEVQAIGMLLEPIFLFLIFLFLFFFFASHRLTICALR